MWLHSVFWLSINWEEFQKGRKLEAKNHPISSEVFTDLNDTNQDEWNFLKHEMTFFSLKINYNLSLCIRLY